MIYVEMCKFYYWNNRAMCKLFLRASVKCHIENKKCPKYEPSESYFDER